MIPLFNLSDPAELKTVIGEYEIQLNAMVQKNHTLTEEESNLILIGPSTSAITRPYQFSYSNRYIFDFFLQYFKEIQDSLEKRDEPTKQLYTKYLAETRAILVRILHFYLKNLQTTEVNTFFNESKLIPAFFDHKDIPNDVRYEYLNRFVKDLNNTDIPREKFNSTFLFRFKDAESFVNLNTFNELFTKLLLYVFDHGDEIFEVTNDEHFVLEEIFKLIVERFVKGIPQWVNDYDSLSQSNKDNMRIWISRINGPLVILNVYTYLLDDDSYEKKPYEDNPKLTPEQNKAAKEKHDIFDTKSNNLAKYFYSFMEMLVNDDCVPLFYDPETVTQLLLSKYDITNVIDKTKYTNKLRELLKVFVMKESNRIIKMNKPNIHDYTNVLDMIIIRSLYNLKTSINSSIDVELLYNAYRMFGNEEFKDSIDKTLRLGIIRLHNQTMMYILPILNFTSSNTIDISELTNNLTISSSTAIIELYKNIVAKIKEAIKIEEERLKELKKELKEAKEEDPDNKDKIEEIGNNITEKEMLIKDYTTKEKYVTMVMLIINQVIEKTDTLLSVK